MSTTPLVTRPSPATAPPEDTGLALPSLLGADPPACGSTASDTIADLHLDTVIDAMASGPFQREAWLRLPDDPAAVADRQAVVRDLRRPAIRAAADRFAAAVADVRTELAADLRHYPRPAMIRLLAALQRFAAAIRGFADALSRQRPSSAGLRGVADALARHVRGERFGALADGSTALLTELQAVPAELGIAADTVWADADRGRPPWTDQLTTLFARFAGSTVATRDRPAERPRRYLNHVESQAVDLIAQLQPAAFGRLHAFVATHGAALDPQLLRLAEELRFYLGALRVVDESSARGVRWCLPTLTAAPGAVDVRGMVELALALTTTAPPVPNDLRLDAGQRVVFVTGPNQGGKTTLARAIGQLAYLAALGLPVPAASATLPLHRPVLTHFPHPDDPARHHGGLAEELARLRVVVDAASGPALVILNELLSTTSADDAVQLAGLVLDRFAERGCRVIWVTFLDDLVTGTTGALSLVGQVAPDDAAAPTFRFLAQPPAGRSHAAVLAGRFGLSAAELARRLR